MVSWFGGRVGDTAYKHHPTIEAPSETYPPELPSNKARVQLAGAVYMLVGYLFWFV